MRTKQLSGFFSVAALVFGLMGLGLHALDDMASNLMLGCLVGAMVTSALGADLAELQRQVQARNT